MMRKTCATRAIHVPRAPRSRRLASLPQVRAGPAGIAARAAVARDRALGRGRLGRLTSATLTPVHRELIERDREPARPSSARPTCGRCSVDRGARRPTRCSRRAGNLTARARRVSSPTGAIGGLPPRRTLCAVRRGAASAAGATAERGRARPSSRRRRRRAARFRVRPDAFEPFIDDVERARALPALTPAEAQPTRPLGLRVGAPAATRWRSRRRASDVHEPCATWPRSRRRRAQRRRERCSTCKTSVQESLIAKYRERILAEPRRRGVLLLAPIVVAQPAQLAARATRARADGADHVVIAGGLCKRRHVAAICSTSRDRARGRVSGSTTPCSSSARRTIRRSTSGTLHAVLVVRDVHAVVFALLATASTYPCCARSARRWPSVSSQTSSSRCSAAARATPHSATATTRLSAVRGASHSVLASNDRGPKASASASASTASRCTVTSSGRTKPSAATPT